MSQLNRYFRFIFSAFLMTGLMALTPNLLAEQMIKSDGYTIHYNTFNSSMLTPEIATQYGVERSSTLAVINIAVLDASDTAVTAFFEGEARNAVSQLTTLKFKKVTEGKAIYYIATFDFAADETLSFDISVVPDGLKKRIKLSFSQQFFID